MSSTSTPLTPAQLAMMDEVNKPNNEIKFVTRISSKNDGRPYKERQNSSLGTPLCEEVAQVAEAGVAVKGNFSANDILYI